MRRGGVGAVRRRRGRGNDDFLFFLCPSDDGLTTLSMWVMGLAVAFLYMFACMGSCHVCLEFGYMFPRAVHYL